MKNKKLSELNQYIEAADLALQQAREIMAELGADKNSNNLVKKMAQSLSGNNSTSKTNDQEKIIEGIFNGQSMLGPDGKEYSVPANYASKSKLVEGDTLKLTIQADGSFLFKQIKPADRQRKTGKLILDEITGQFAVLAEDKKYNVLQASVTFFKGEAGDDVTILIPQNQPAQWAAIENIIKEKQNQILTTEQNSANIIPEEKNKLTTNAADLNIQDLADL